MPQQFRGFVALAEDLSQPSVTPGQEDSTLSSGLHGYPHIAYIHAGRQNTPTNKIIIKRHTCRQKHIHIIYR